MSFTRCALASLALAVAICATAASADAADDGLITKASKYSVKETVTRFEAAVKEKEAAGFTVFAEIDHSAAAKKFGLDQPWTELNVSQFRPPRNAGGQMTLF